MKRALLLLAAVLVAPAFAQPVGDLRYNFAVIGSRAYADDVRLRDTLTQLDGANLAFVVAQGIKPANAPCNDTSYLRRREELDASKHGLVISVAATDWASCGQADGTTTALARLTRVRELFFPDEFSFGATRIPLVRQSTEAKFQNFVENARWEIGSVMFATINLPANNNNFVTAAGRNGEFEDRLIANREWLRRVFTTATLKNASAVVLFADANPMAKPGDAPRDGFAETRRHLQMLASRFKGRVLIVHAQAEPEAPAVIQWRGNLGTLGVARGPVRLRVDPALPEVIMPRNPKVQ